jgi:hypothetical protein
MPSRLHNKLTYIREYTKSLNMLKYLYRFWGVACLVIGLAHRHTGLLSQSCPVRKGNESLARPVFLMENCGP